MFYLFLFLYIFGALFVNNCIDNIPTKKFNEIEKTLFTIIWPLILSLILSQLLCDSIYYRSPNNWQEKFTELFKRLVQSWENKGF